MKTANTSAPAVEALPDLQTAQQELATLEASLAELRPEWLALECRFGDEYRQAAAGMQVDPDDAAELDALVARERILRIQVTRAKEVLKRAELRAGIRVVLETELAVAAERDVYLAHAKQAAQALATLAAHLQAMVPIGERMVDLTLRKVRGGSTLTDQGYISKGDIVEIARVQHLQTLIERDLNARLGWFTCPNSLIYGNPSFDVSCEGSASLFMDAVDVLFDLPHADPAEVDAVRAEMLAARKGRVATSGDTQQPAPTARFLELEEN